MADQTNPQVKKDELVSREHVALLDFVDKLIKERNDPNLTGDSLLKMKEFLLKELNDSINRRLVNLLTEKDQLDLDNLMNKNVSSVEIDKFFESKIPNLDAEVAAVLLNVRDAYLLPMREQMRNQAPDSKPQPPSPQPAVNNNTSSDFPVMPAPSKQTN